MNADYALSRGRRFGGCAILWNISLKCSVEPIVCSNNRLCVVKVIFDSYSIIVCNMYMPCDNTGDINTYNEVWADAINICNAHDAQYVIFAGDLNTDLTRHNSAHTTGLIDLCRSENFTCVKTHPQCQIDYSYESKINGQKSCLDHFIISDNLHDSVQSCYVAHDYDNMSDHSVVYLNLLLNFDVSHILVDTVIENVSKPMWWKASHGNIVNYKTHLDQLLNDIDLPVHVISCTDVMCDRHRDNIQLYHDNIVTACLQASTSCIPMSKPGQRGRNIPGWNNYVKSHSETAKFWHGLWKANGSPNSGILFDIRRKTRYQYHRVLKCIARNKSTINASKIAEGFINNCNMNFWSEIKKIQGHQHTMATNIDGINDAPSIANHFHDKYR